MLNQSIKRYAPLDMNTLRPQNTLINWANQQQHWVRQIVDKVLSQRGPLSQDDISDVYHNYLIEKQLRKGELIKYPKLSSFLDDDENIPPFQLKSIQDVTDVNRLAPNQKIDFNSNMTVIFGENATGKSGYTRILKTIANTRSVEPILPNVYQRTTSKPAATIIYSLAHNDVAYYWADENGFDHSQRLTVFDANAVPHHLSREQSFLVVPRVLTHFDLIYTAIGEIREMIEKGNTLQKVQKKDFSNLFQSGTDVYTFIKDLNATTKCSELEALTENQDDIDQRVKQLSEELSLFNTTANNAILELAQADETIFKELKTFADSVASFGWDAYNRLAGDINNIQQDISALTNVSFEQDDIPSADSEIWLNFIEAGEKYLAHLNQQDYPLDHDRCIYCRQILESEATVLLRKYRNLFDQSLNDELEVKVTEINGIKPMLLNLNPVAIREKLDPKNDESEKSSTKAPLESSIEFLTTMQIVVQCMQDNHHIEFETLTFRAKAVSKNAENALRQARQNRKAAQRRQCQSAVEQRPIEAELRELTDKTQLAKHVTEIQDYMAKLKLVKKTDEALAKFPQLLRSLTIQSNTASKDLIDRNFESAFQQECEYLNAPTVIVDFPGRQGKTARRKTVTTNHQITDVLSEGEQKVIALADFLAESSMVSGASTFLFDDPVNSMDYRRIENIASRLRELSECSQVIVFTHNIWFATSLLSKFESDPSKCGFFNSETDDGKNTGLISPGSHPNWDTPKKLRGRINDLLNRAQSVSGEEKSELIAIAYSRLRAWCEVVTEQELLADVVQRYRPNVMMTKLSQIKPDRLENAVKVISRVFDNACRATEAHSHPLETLNTRPTLDDLKQDRDTAFTALLEYKQGN